VQGLLEESGGRHGSFLDASIGEGREMSGRSRHEVKYLRSSRFRALGPWGLTAGG
jgi:hypothetical protein